MRNVLGTMVAHNISLGNQLRIYEVPILIVFSTKEAVRTGKSNYFIPLAYQIVTFVKAEREAAPLDRPLLWHLQGGICGSALTARCG